MIAGLVLAAGAGRRFGRPKALVRYRGELFVDRACHTLAEGGCATVFAVLGASAEVVQSRARLPHARAVHNPDWASGMASSLRAGLAAATRSGAISVIVLPVDVPGASAEAVRRIASHARGDALAAASFEGHRGHPVLLGQEHWAGISQVASGDSGAREYLRTRNVTLVPCDDVADSRDVDSPGDLPSE